MTAGVPLNDHDRGGWLVSLRQGAVAALAMGAPAVVLTCSALKQKYRDVIRAAEVTNPAVRVHFFYLHLPETALMERVRARQGHYMKASMVRSQLRSLEVPTAAEPDVHWLDVRASRDDVLHQAMSIVSSVQDGLA